MLIALAYCLRDYQITQQLIEWIRELGGCTEHELLLLHDARVPNQNMVDITALAGKTFKKVTPIVGAAKIDGWPQGANYMWRTVTNVLSYRSDVRFFLWLEPDAIPLKEGWAEALEKEFIDAAGKGARFMGDRVEVEDIPLHMSGVGIYPNPLHEFSGEAYRAHDVAWDMAGKDQIVPLAHFTRLIEHAWKHPTFTMISELQTQIRPEAILFHASKDGSLIKVLRESRDPRRKAIEKHFESVPPYTEEQMMRPRWHDPENEEVRPRVHCRMCGSPPHPDSVGHSFLPDKVFMESDGSGTPDKPKSREVAKEVLSREPLAGRRDPSFSCDIFIRTYPGDYPWLRYCLRSINKYASGFRKVWIVSPQDNPLSGDIGYEWKQMNDETEDGYLAQQCTKLYADVITDYAADYILHIDSDTLFTRPVSPQDFLVQCGKDGEERQVRWRYTPYENIKVPWQPIMEKFFGFKPSNEFMRRFPIMVPRWLYPRLREFCYQKHGVVITDYVRNQPLREFSEFNAMGTYAYHYHHDKVTWLNTLTEESMPEELREKPFARQFFSWGGITEEVKAEIENILGDRVTNASKTTEKISPPAQPFCIDDIKADLPGTESEPATQPETESPVPHPTSVPAHVLLEDTTLQKFAPAVDGAFAEQLIASISIYDHVRALAEHARKGEEEKRYVRKLIYREGVVPRSEASKRAVKK